LSDLKFFLVIGYLNMADSCGAGFEPTLVTSRWSLVQFALLACYTTGFHGITSFPYYIHKHSGKVWFKMARSDSAYKITCCLIM